MEILTSPCFSKFVPSSTVRPTKPSCAFVEIPINGVLSRTSRVYSQIVAPNHKRVALTVRASTGGGDQSNSGFGGSDRDNQISLDLLKKLKELSDFVREVVELGQTGNTRAAFDLLNKKKVEKINAGHYSTLIKLVCETGDTDTALDLLKRMKERGFGKPDNATCITLIDELYRTGKTDAALNLQIEMEVGQN